MVSKEEINEILRRYDLGRLSVATIGSHSALNILRGAKDEGLRAVCICLPRDEKVYRRFKVADEIIIVGEYREILRPEVQERLRELNAIVVPHGSFNAYVGAERLRDEFAVPLFGNRELLVWESRRDLQAKWLSMAGVKTPKSFDSPESMEGLCIVKLYGCLLYTSPSPRDRG